MILGIHGLKTDVKKYNFWPNLKKIYGEEIYIPQLPNGDCTTYKEWKKELLKIDFEKYDTILAHSMGTRIILEYLNEFSIKVNKLILLSPAFSSFTNKIDENTGGIKKREELEYTFNTLENKYLTEDLIFNIVILVDNILLFHSKKDYRISHLGIRYFLKNLPKEKIKIIENSEFGHFLEEGSYKYFNDYLK